MTADDIKAQTERLVTFLLKRRFAHQLTSDEYHLAVGEILSWAESEYRKIGRKGKTS